VTGIGTVNPLGPNVSDTLEGLLAGRSGIAPIRQMDPSKFRVHFGGEVKNFRAEEHLDPRQASRLDRFAQFALVSAIQAVEDCGIDFGKEDGFRCGTMIGSGIGGMNEFEAQYSRFRDTGPRQISPFVIPRMIANSASGIVSIQFGLRGPNTAVATACSSAAHSMGDAYHAIKWDLADVMVTGGSESAITEMGLGGFCALRALSMRNEEPERASRPFDRERDGFVLAEGSGILVFEELERAKARGAKIYAEILGVGNTADAYHITAPHEDGLGAARAMSDSIRHARLNPEQIDYVNAHGTSTQMGDVAETKAMKTVFGTHAHKMMVSSTKSMIGHLLGASGGVELIATILMIRDGVVHPTINLENPDPQCDLDYVPKQARPAKVRYALSNSFGFGGHNCALTIGAFAE